MSKFYQVLDYHYYEKNIQHRFAKNHTAPLCKGD